MSMAFVIGTFQSDCKSEHNQVKWIKWHMTSANLTVFFYLQNSTLLEWLLKFIPW